MPTVSLFDAEVRPDLVRQAEALIGANYPVFMQHDPISIAYWDALYGPGLAQFQTMAVETDVAGREVVVAVGNAVPFRVPETGTPDAYLPENGWDGVLQSGVEGAREGQPANALSALSIVVDPNHRGTGVAQRLLGAMKSAAVMAHLSELFAPVRPTRKADYPLHTFERYVAWKNADGAPFDPWLRTHWKLGARPITIAPRSMVFPGSIKDWQSWTGLRFLESGLYHFPGGLAPLAVDLDAQSAVYVEPNVWMQHVLD